MLIKKCEEECAVWKSGLSLSLIYKGALHKVHTKRMCVSLLELDILQLHNNYFNLGF